MKLAVVGSREFPDAAERVFAYINAYVDRLTPFEDLDIISGGARGVDHAAWEAANKLRLDIVEYKANWSQFGKAAGFIRNEDIIRHADAVVAFWDGESRGTKNSIDWALRLKKRLEVVFP